jgi:hypothetical protein
MKYAPYYDVDSMLENPAQFSHLGRAVNSPFLTADVARPARGGYTVIEIAGILLFGALWACGATSRSPDGKGEGGASVMASGGTAGSGGAMNAGASGVAGSGGFSCATPWQGFTGCRGDEVCQEPTTERGNDAVGTLCRPEFGVYPVEGPCKIAHFKGRCLLELDGYWIYFYDDAAIPESCRNGENPWCDTPTGVSRAGVDACESACAAAKPDFSRAPECEAAIDCASLCLEQVRARTDDCAACIAASITWRPSGCNDFECSCVPPSFASAEGASCAASCDAG